MLDALIAAVASVTVGVLSLVGVMVTNSRANNKMQSEMKTQQVLTDERLCELTREVRMHNDFARRIPVIEEKIKTANHRIDDLEGFHKPV
ncbi:MAG: hypothetical protein U0M06_12210 [Clostridia bacterium]|nr:hypothetical protein [Clostridia bacterium]